MKNILVVGNGFDLAHGLLTKYEHFLYLMKHWDEFYNRYEKELKSAAEYVQSDLLFLFEDPIGKYIKNAANLDKSHIDKLGAVIKENSWAKYYCNCEAEIDGWIDFERELYPAIE